MFLHTHVASIAFYFKTIFTKASLTVMATILLVSNMLGFAEHTFISARAQSSPENVHVYCLPPPPPPPQCWVHVLRLFKNNNKTHTYTHTHTHTHTAMLLSIFVVEQPLKSSRCGIRADFVKTHAHTTNDHNKTAPCGMIKVFLNLIEAVL